MGNFQRHVWVMSSKVPSPCRYTTDDTAFVACDGGEDPRCSAALARRWSARRAVHPDGGHDLSLDDPGWLADTLADWAGGDPARD